MQSSTTELCSKRQTENESHARSNMALNRTSWRRAFGRAEKPPVNLDS
jgi:hypothetical protein